MTLRARLALGIAAIILLLIAPVAYAVRSLTAISREMQELEHGEFRGSLLLGRMRAGIEDVRRLEILLATIPEDSTRLPAFEATIDTLRARADSLAGKNLDSVSARVRTGLEKLGALGVREHDAALADQRRKTDLANGIATQEVRPIITLISDAIRDAELQLDKLTSTRVVNAAESITTSTALAIGALFGALLLATTIAVWLTLSISRPVHDLERGMRAVASGDFGHRLEVNEARRDEFGHLSASFHSMAQQLAQLDKLKAEFVSVASHELKTPINVILGYLQLLQEGVYGAITPRQQEICATLSTQAQSLSRLVRHLLDVSRFDAGVSRLEQHEMHLASFLWELENAFRVLAMQRGVTFTVERGAELPTTVVWDEDRMNEVLGNLLSNAFKFTERGGEVKLQLSDAGKLLRIDVRDTGAGIAPEELPRIFDKFFQADNQLAASAKGTGLGLAIAKRIVEAHHGKLSVDSTVGVGTTFTILLPMVGVPRRTGDVPRVATRVGVG